MKVLKTLLLLATTSLVLSGIAQDENMEKAFPIFKLGGGYYASEGDMTSRFGNFGGIA